MKLMFLLAAITGAYVRAEVPMNPSAHREFLRCTNNSSDPQQKEEISIYVPLDDKFESGKAQKVRVTFKDKSFGYEPAGAGLIDGEMTVSTEHEVAVSFNFFTGAATEYNLKGVVSNLGEVSTPAKIYDFKLSKAEAQTEKLSCVQVRFGN